MREAVAAGRVTGVDPQLEGAALFALARGPGTGVALHGEPAEPAEPARRALTSALRRAPAAHVELSAPGG